MEMGTSKVYVSERKLYILSFFIPVILMIGVWIALDIYPFGKYSILVSDLEIQFVDYYAYFKSVISGENDFIYTFSKNLGGDMPGFSAYYLQNPLLFLLCLFSDRNLPTAVMLMIVVQIGLSGFSFSYFINHMYEPKYSSLLFSTAYSFMGFFFGYIPLTIYFTNFALLPIVILGINKIMENPKHYKTYLFSLALYIFMNYYLGFMMCIFSILYFLYLLLIKSKKICNLRNYGKNIIAYMVSSVFAVLLVAFDLAMVAISLRGQKENPDLSKFGFYRQFRILDIFSKLFAGSDKNHELPIIYCSVLAVVCVLFYFINRQVKLREKVLTAGFFALILLSFNIHAIDIIWHGFNDPVGFKYRYAYFFSFLMIVIGYHGFQLFYQNISRKQICIISGVFSIYSCYLLITGNRYANWKDILLNGILLILILSAFWCIGRDKLFQKRAGWILLFFVLGGEVVFNAVRAISVYPMGEISKFTNYYDNVSPVIEYVKETDDGFYRIEKDFYRDKNDSMLFNYAGLSHSSSCEKDYVKEFSGKMGFRNNILFAFYNRGSTTFADSLLGVKYYISQYDTTDKPYHKITEINNCHIFENPYVLPVGFCVQDDIYQVDMQTDNVFDIQNQISKTFDSNLPDIYKKTEPDYINVSNLNENDIGGITEYSKINSEEDAYIEYIFEIKEKKGLYLYFNAPNLQSAELFINDFSRENYFTNTNWNVVYAGMYNPGDTVTVRLKCLQDTISITNALFYYENKETLKSWYENSDSKNIEITKNSSSHLTGIVDIPEGKENLVFSIPCEKGWNIKIDGKEAGSYEVLGALMSVKVSPGKHTIEMRYIPEGFFPAIWVSLLAFAMLMFFIINDKMKCNN